MTDLTPERITAFFDRVAADWDDAARLLRLSRHRAPRRTIDIFAGHARVPDERHG
jgi:hypothetical protein